MKTKPKDGERGAFPFEYMEYVEAIDCWVNSEFVNREVTE